jgi:hypothetical protein
MRKYLTIDHDKGYPAGPAIYYECGKCGDVLASQPKENIGCSCSNIFIDVEWGRLAIRDHERFKAFVQTE